MSDFEPIFTQMGYTVTGNSKIKVGMEFTPSGTIIVSMDSAALSAILKPVMQQEFDKRMQQEGISKVELEAQLGMTVDEYIDSYIALFHNGWNYVTAYKFAGDTLLIQDTISKDFVESEYEFTDDNTLVTIDEGIRETYTRVS